MPQPISSTRLPAHRSNCANPGICGSTKYFRASTSSKYCFVPITADECRILQGRLSQKDSTSESIGRRSNEASADKDDMLLSEANDIRTMLVSEKRRAGNRGRDALDVIRAATRKQGCVTGVDHGA